MVQAKRAVEMRRLGGRDWPHRSFVSVVMGFNLLLLLLFDDILIVKWRWRVVVVVVARGFRMGGARNEQLPAMAAGGGIVSLLSLL